MVTYNFLFLKSHEYFSKLLRNGGTRFIDRLEHRLNPHPFLSEISRV